MSPRFSPFLLFCSLLHHQWLSQYQGLTLTSRGQHSALPNLKIPICLFDTKTNIKNTNPDNRKNDRKDSSNNEVRNENENSNKNENKNEFKGEGDLSAESYVRYLKLYARRFGLESYMKLGYTVVKVCRAEESLHSTSSQLQGSRTLNSSINTSNESRIESFTEKCLLLKRYKWEVHYKQLYGNNKDQIFVNYCNSVVIACGKAQIPVTDENLLTTLKGFAGQVVDAKEIKNIKG